MKEIRGLRTVGDVYRHFEATPNLAAILVSINGVEVILIRPGGDMDPDQAVSFLNAQWKMALGWLAMKPTP